MQKDYLQIKKLFQAIMFLLYINIILILPSCAGHKKNVRQYNTGNIWQELRKEYRAKPVFKGQGKIYIKTRDFGKMQIGFDCAAKSDSMLRLNLHSMLLGNIADLIVVGNRFRLTIPFRKEVINGIYADTLFRPYLHTDLPLQTLFCVFTARPLMPLCNYFSASSNVCEKTVQQQGQKTGRLRMQLDSVKNIPSELKVFEHGHEQYAIKWQKYKNRIPYSAGIYFSNGNSLIIIFDNIEQNPVLSEDIFDITSGLNSEKR